MPLSWGQPEALRNWPGASKLITGLTSAEEEAASVASYPIRRYTPEEYLEGERAAEFRSEYFGGEIVAMAGNSLEHITIVSNIILELGTRFRGTPCRALATEMRVQIQETGAYVYPDVVVLCRPPQLSGSRFDVLLNPEVIIEVLSPSTEAHDRGLKWAHYRRLGSLQEYILVSQDQALIERYVREETGDWLLKEYIGLESTLAIDSASAAIPLAAIYDRVEFPATV